MKPTAPRALPWLATCCLALACDGERKAEPASPTDATSKPGGKAEAPGKADATPKAATTQAARPEVKAEATKADATKPDATKPDAVLPATKPTPPTTTPVTPRPVLFYREAPKYRIKLWALPEATAPDPAAARSLGIIADGVGGSIDHGTSGPVLSADGQWLAYLDSGRLELSRLDGTAKHRITKHKGSRVSVLISGFSPDSSRLVFHQGEVQSEEGAALPKDVVPGFQELTLADRTLAPKTSLQAFTWFSDDRHVIFQRRLPDRSTALVRFDLDTGAEEELQRTTAPYGFSQLTLHGDRIAYVHHPADGRSQMVTDALEGGARTDIGPEGDFAQLQWPRFSLDGRHISYTDETTLLIHALADGTGKTLTTCTQRHCSHNWDGASTAIVLDGGQLSRVSLDGTVTKLATDVAGFVVAGAPE
jgi:hypothetical protein